MHLKNLFDDIQARLSDQLKLNMPRRVTLPFEVNVAHVDICLQENQIEETSHLTIWPAEWVVLFSGWWNT